MWIGTLTEKVTAHAKRTKKKNLWLHFASWNLADSKLCLESKTKIHWGVGTPHRKSVHLEGGTPYILSGREKHKLRIHDGVNC